MCTEVAIQRKGRTNSSTPPPPPPPHDSQRTRHRALLTRIFPRHGAALNGSPQAEVEGRQEPCWAPSLYQQRHVRRTPPAAMPPRTATTAGRYRRSRRSPCPADKEAGKSHQPAVSSSRMRSEAGPKRGINKAPSGRAANQAKRQQNRRTQRPRLRSQPLQRADTGEHDCR